MKRRQIGRTDLHVNEIGYGGMSLSFSLNRPPEQESIALLQRGVDDCGIEFIDTADAYCQSDDEMHHNERLIAKALTGARREKVVIATKGGFIRPEGKWIPDGRPSHLREACEESLRALATDCIDLYQFHRPDPAVPIEESLGALNDLQTEGKIRYIGVSNFSLAQLEAAMKVAMIESLQNPLGFHMYDEEKGALLTYCEENHITWIAYAPVGGHRNAQSLPQYTEWLTANVGASSASPYSLALAWLLHLSPMIIPIPATTKFEHLAENMRAAGIVLTAEDVEQMKHAKRVE